MSKVLRISYELPKSKNSFINIEKEEGSYNNDDSGCVPQINDDEEESSGVFPRANAIINTGGNENSSMTKDGDKTELQDFTKAVGMVIHNGDEHINTD